MNLVWITLADFRSFSSAELRPSPEGVTAITGANGTGKTTLLEAVAYLGAQRSFRNAAREHLVRTGTAQALLRAELEREGSTTLVEALLPITGRPKTQVNRQVARTRRELAAAVPFTAFTPDDVGIVQGPPAGRRELLDDLLHLIDPQGARAIEDTERALRQRAALLRQAGGHLTAEVVTTLEVWDSRLAEAGTALANAREAATGMLRPLVAETYAALAGRGSSQSPSAVGVEISYRRSWSEDLLDALATSRSEDARRAATTVGPHHDDLAIVLDHRDARYQGSQGEQRCLALALRLAGHHLVTEIAGTAPILLLDDVFSELDPDRARALVRALPAGQALLTTAAELPSGLEVAEVVDIGKLAGASVSCAAAHELPGRIETAR
ncbi:MAG: DNA replication and repair protein RecF [Actinomycetota bacterium]|nr:DNA replication and repair protein RecF [Actinomycetota bacterium]